MQVILAIDNSDYSAEAIREVASWSADLIVMGSHGYTGIKRLLLGSIALSWYAMLPVRSRVVRRKHEKTGSEENRSISAGS